MDTSIKTLGNLAIITQSLNASIRDSNWPTKKRGSGNKEGLKHYSGGIETLAPYLDLDEWNETEIEKRSDFLLKKATEIWTAEEMPIDNTIKIPKTEVYEKFNLPQRTEIQEVKNYSDDINGRIKPKQFSRDKTKYVINGNGIRLPKNRFVLEFVREYLRKNPTSFRELKNIFLDEYQGSTGVINQLDFVERKYSNQADKRHFLNDDEILTSSDNIKFVVSTQWKLDNVKNILKVAKRTGFEIDEIKKGTE